MMEIPVRCMYACTRALLHMPTPKKEAYHAQNTKIRSSHIITHFVGEKASCKSTLCRESIYTFFMSICEGDPNPL